VSWSETAVVFPCQQETLVGVLAAPEPAAPRGVLIVVGGPQYRAGSHRQFTLLARHLADAGIASLRFDYRGMGDSSGALRTFEHAGEDIRHAIDQLMARVPALREVVIWGLCDAASAALFYAHDDPRVAGLVLLNPWVRTEQGMARAELKHYYTARLFQRSFWHKLWHGGFDPRRAAREFGRRVLRALVRPVPATAAALPERMQTGLRRFRGPVLLILSGNDLTAQEFRDMVARSRGWRSLLHAPRVTQRMLREADHTFSRREWRDQVAAWTADWTKPA
jgi:exosortase A-associated hydrolase 1